MDFHVARDARDRYGFEEAFFSLHGDVVFADLAASRRFAQRINEARTAAGRPEEPVHAAQLDALGLMHEVFHHVIAAYRREHGPAVLGAVLDSAGERLGGDEIAATLRTFTDAFPSLPVYRGELSVDDYLAGGSDGMTHREVVFEELLLLWVANQNPALERYGEFFDDTRLERSSRYPDLVRAARGQLGGVTVIGGEDLISTLLAPARAAPDSLSGQLRYIRERWGYVLGGLLERLVQELDVLTEDERALWMRFHGGGGDAGGEAADAAALHAFGGLDAEAERFSPDRDWMPRVVLMAKSTYVWLDQLSRQYGRAVRTLDAIPDDELDRLARAGFSGLWLIGLWERSPASQRIKQLRGNLDAVASAYSLRDYRIAEDLGGEAAYEVLRDRAWARGIRLASDMVPNHMGIDSRWVVEHPEWFISREDSPYPAYTFRGPNLSNDERVGIYLEDHYYDSSDAAVVFKRVDRGSGQERYVYHGNDGTSFPWNDTAQIDYLNPEAREAVIGAILEVARRFPIIRFDAAMVLARKHIQRLWYPEPGSAGAIPSRAESSLTRAQFEAALPEEFWRQVVDRVAAEVPGTLLLAEAFWLMEGYFVRTLGMHRVYNSAFMNMMRDERNAEYRAVIKNTISFDPQILKRYVNFMNNPDERTAVDQFGKGDKYFGVATVMATMPGLPMFGHGQVEGFTEKYGMEFRRAYLDETPDEELVANHERRIFPLLHRRYLFAEADGFRLYDFVADDGSVVEDVFAYSNRAGDARSLVVFHNRDADTSGRIHVSAPFPVRTDGERTEVSETLAESLGLDGHPDGWLVLRDAASGLEYLRNAQTMAGEGLRLSLHAYECRAYTDVRDVRDDASRMYARLAERLGERGVPSLDEALRELALEPLTAAFAALVTPAAASELAALARATGDATQAEGSLAGTGVLADSPPALVRQLVDRAGTFADEAVLRADDKPLALREAYLADLRDGLEGALRLAHDAGGTLPALDEQGWLAVLAWLAARGLGGPPDADEHPERMRSRLREWRLDRAIAAAFQQLGRDATAARRAADAVVALLVLPTWRPDGGTDAVGVIEAWLRDEDARRAVGVHEHEGLEWFDAAAWIDLATWTTWRAAILLGDQRRTDTAQTPRTEAWAAALGREVALTGEASGYRVDGLPRATAQPAGASTGTGEA